MLSDLKPQPADKILELMQLFRDDPRPQKIDLGVGVYKNAEGVTPVMRRSPNAMMQTGDRMSFPGNSLLMS